MKQHLVRIPKRGLVRRAPRGRGGGASSSTPTLSSCSLARSWPPPNVCLSLSSSSGLRFASTSTTSTTTTATASSSLGSSMPTPNVHAVGPPAALLSWWNESSLTEPSGLLLQQQRQRRPRRVAFSTLVTDDEVLRNPAARLSTDLLHPEALLKELGMKPDDVWDWAQRKPTPLRLADMYQYAANPDFRIPNAVFLHTELPIRIAQRAVDLLTLPFGLSDALPIRQVACTYIRYLHTILETPVPQSKAQEENFTHVLQSMVLDRSSIPHAIAQGLAIWQRQEGTTPAQDPERYHEMEEALYRFFTARVGLRFLTEHHVLSSPNKELQSQSVDLRQVTSMFGQDEHDRADTVGCIQSHTDLAKEVSRVANMVRKQCAEEFGCPAPAIEIVDCQTSRQGNKNENDDDDDGFTYVPHHLHYMMLELLKNSVRATLRHAQKTGKQTMEPIRVVMVKGAEDVTIKVADKAGGIPRSRMAQIWKFAHSTDADETASLQANASGAQLRGFGLPITRIYARYFGGELTLKSMEGYGLDAYLHLPRLGKSGEHLPPRVRSSPGELDSLPMSSSASNTSYGRFWTIGGARQFSTSPSWEDELRNSFLSVTAGACP